MNNPARLKSRFARIRRVARQIPWRTKVKYVLALVFCVLLVEALRLRLEFDTAVHDQMLRASRWMRSGGEHSRHIVIVRLTNQAAQLGAGHGGPGVVFRFPRGALATVINTVHACRPGAVVLDVFLEDLTVPAEDEALRQALAARPGRTVVAQGVKVAMGELRPVAPHGAFAATGAWFAPAFFGVEEDRVVRRAPVVVSGPDGEEQPTLPVVASRLVATNLQVPGEPFRLDFRGRGTTYFPSFDASGILAFPEQAKARLQEVIRPDTIVVIGTFHDSSGDLFPVPRCWGDEHGKLWGSVLLAYAMETLLEGSAPRDLSGWGTALVAVVAVAGGIAIPLFWPAPPGRFTWHRLVGVAWAIGAAGMIAVTRIVIPYLEFVVLFAAVREITVLVWERFEESCPRESPGVVPGAPAAEEAR